MADILMFHHVQGLTPGLTAFADTLRAAGHTVHTPDLFDGATFETLDEGMAHVRGLGFDTVLDRGVAAAEALPESLFYVGFSLGAMPAQKLAQTRPGARGAVLLHGCVPASEFSDAWPATLPLQIHAMQDDEFFADDAEAANELIASAPGVAELFRYPGNAHLFTDSSLPSYDKEATDLLTTRVLSFLS